ncbi:hypothetical protein SAMN02745746_00939, partial [Pseudogulbenkiania subflava DSM 22618]
VGEPAGSNSAATSETTSGSIGFTSPDGIQAVSLGGHVLTGTSTTFPVETLPNGTTGQLTASYVYDAATGIGTISYSYTLLDNTAGDNTNASFAVVVTDADGDSAPAGNLVINIVDDVPSAFTPDTAHMVDQTATTHSVTDELNFTGHTGADGVGSVIFTQANGTPIVEGLAAHDVNGNLLTVEVNGVAEQLYLFYYRDPVTLAVDKTELIATTNEFYSTNGDPEVRGFIVDIDPLTDSYTLTTFGIIASGMGDVQVTDLSSIGGGSVTIKGITDVGGTTQDVILSSTSGPVNTDKDDIGVGNGQTLNSTDNVRIDFVNGLTIDKNGYSYTDHNTVSGFEQLVYITGNPNSTANLTLTAIVADNDQIYGTTDAGETQLNLSVSNITIYDASHNIVANNTQGLSITDLGNSILITGMHDGWSYQISSTDTFSAVNVAGATDTDTFSLGAFSYSQEAPGQPIDLSFGVTASDGDGDTVASQIDATLYPADRSVVGDDSPNINLVATVDHPYVFGYGGDDTLDGSIGHAVLVGGDGNDLLIYGIGDTIDGGNGVDTVRFDTAGLVDLTGAKLSDVEQLQMNGAATHTTLQLRPEDVLNFTNNADHTLFVRGQSGDAVNIDVVDPATAPAGTTVNIGGVEYTQFHLDVSGTTVTINVENTVTHTFI